MNKELPPGLALQKVDERIMTLNVGPQHPGSGHMRIIVQIDGEFETGAFWTEFFSQLSTVNCLLPTDQSG